MQLLPEPNSAPFVVVVEAKCLCTVASICFRSRLLIDGHARLRAFIPPPPEVDQTKVALYVVSFAVVVQGDAKRIMRTLRRRPSVISPPTALLWAAGVPDCSGCCGLTAPCPCVNHHCPRWRSHFQSDFSCFWAGVGGGRSPRCVAQPAVALLDCHAQEGIGGRVGACRRVARLVDRCRSSEARCIRSGAKGAHCL